MEFAYRSTIILFVISIRIEIHSSIHVDYYALVNVGSTVIFGNGWRCLVELAALTLRRRIAIVHAVIQILDLLNFTLSVAINYALAQSTAFFALISTCDWLS